MGGGGRAYLTTAGMALWTGVFFLFSSFLGGVMGHGFVLLGGLALFGSGLGLFIAPNNSATMATAPDDRSGEAGGL